MRASENEKLVSRRFLEKCPNVEEILAQVVSFPLYWQCPEEGPCSARNKKCVASSLTFWSKETGTEPRATTASRVGGGNARKDRLKKRQSPVSVYEWTLCQVSVWPQNWMCAGQLPAPQSTVKQVNFYVNYLPTQRKQCVPFKASQLNCLLDTLFREI